MEEPVSAPATIAGALGIGLIAARARARGPVPALHRVGLLLTATAAIAAAIATLLPGRRTSPPPPRAEANGGLVMHIQPAWPGLQTNVLRDRHNSPRKEIAIRKERGMTDTTSPALRTALAYYQAWTSRDLDKAMSYIADDIVCDAPAGRLEGADAYRGFLGPFVQILTGATMIAAFGDDQTALVMYDTQTVPVKSAPGAECVTVKDSKITYSRFVFDRAPFDAARTAAS